MRSLLKCRWVWWVMPIALASREADIQGVQFEVASTGKASETLFQRAS
jgi:hypothetical protein